MSRRRLMKSIIFLFSLSLILVGNASYASAEEKLQTITKGVFIDGVDVSGMTKTEAEEALKNFVKELRDKSVAVPISDQVIYTTLGELGYEIVPNDNIDQALNLGKAGSLIRRYKDLKDIEKGGKVYPQTYTIDENKIREFIRTKVEIYNIEPVNASVARKNGEFVYTDHIVGKKVEIEETTRNIKTAILNNWNHSDLVVDAVWEDDVPIYTKEIIEQVDTVIGSFTTEYADSAEGRAANLANGAKLINNTVLYPGEVFSAYEHLAPFTKENGYYTAGAYLQGKVIDSIGGGACQVTTTLYNAILEAELEVVERQPHSMTISYVDLSRDAAIAGTYKDLKFKNNTDVPIVIEAYTKGRRITFKIWGKENRDTKKRRVEYITRVISETPAPPDVITEDPTQPVTYRKVTQSAHTGYKAELYKVVYEDDVEISRTLVNKSSYAPAPRYITVGTKPLEETENQEMEVQPGDQQADNEDRKDREEESDDKTEDSEEDSRPADTDNLTNPEGQLQGDIFWDPVWDEEDILE